MRIKVPAALTAQYGTHLAIGAPVAFGHRGAEWAERAKARRAVRYDITHDPAAKRWYLDASWKQGALTAAPSIEHLRSGPVLGVDVNADHLACCLLDGSGNPVGEPITIRVGTARLAARVAMGGFARRSLPSWIARPMPEARRWSSRTSTSPRPAQVDAKRWAAASGASGSAAPWLVSPPRASAPGLLLAAPARHRDHRCRPRVHQ